MANYSYRAIDPLGKERSGSVSAENEADARQLLEKKKLHLLELGLRDSNAAGLDHSQKLSLQGFFQPKISPNGLMLFTRQLGTLITVTPLEEALRSIIAQTEKPKEKTILAHVHAGVLEGQGLAEAMGREPKTFPSLYRAMIAAGEKSGTLPKITERLSNLLEREADMRSKILKAVAYPAVLAVVAMAVVAALMIAVVPRIAAQFDTVGQQLPLVTRIVMGTSNLLAATYWIIGLVLVLAGLILWWLLKKPTFRMAFDGWMLRLPLVGRLLRGAHAARMARTLSTMVASHVPLVEGVHMTAKTVRNHVLKKASYDISEAVRSGSSLSGAMRETGRFPPLLLTMAASGEASGELAPMLERAAEYLERETENFTETALTLLEPTIIVLMGGIVGFIILSILLPILALQNLAAI